VTTRAYLLENDFNHSGDLERDAFLVPSKVDPMIGMIINYIERVALPDAIYFQANFELIPKYDFPLTDLTIPVMSKKMLNVIKRYGDFDFRTVPVIMIDDTYLEGPFDTEGNLKRDVPINDDYVVIQLLKYTDAFDREASEYIMRRGRPDKVGAIRKLVLREPVSGFPSLFKIPELSNKLFVNESVKCGLIEAGILGCVFEEVDAH
jgi:hypothetical protein